MMCDFKKELLRIDQKKLRSILLSLTSPCNEAFIYGEIFENLSINKTSALTLYQNHFLLFHSLYLLQTEFFKLKKYLHVHFSAVFLTDYPEKGKCRFYMEKDGCFCESLTSLTEVLCEFHSVLLGEKQLDELSSRYFYLDDKNYYKMDKTKAEHFINGTWELLSYHQEYTHALGVLGLSERSDVKTIKKRFKDLAKQYHPDMLESKMSKDFYKINNAYRLVLKLKSQFLS